MGCLYAQMSAGFYLQRHDAAYTGTHGLLIFDGLLEALIAMGSHVLNNHQDAIDRTIVLIIECNLHLRISQGSVGLVNETS